jgi:cytochrome b
MSVGTPDPGHDAGRLVWDLPVRIAHWALVVSVAGAWATHYAGTEWFPWHRRLGYVTLVLVVFRIAWGFVGTRHARFSNFLRGPGAVIDYVRSGARVASAGHNPLGGLSVIAMLALLLVQAATGLYSNDEIASAGPFYGWISHETSNRIAGVHEANANLLLALIALHLLAVGWYTSRARQPLVRAMLTGRKDSGEVPADEAIAGSRTVLAALIVAVLGVALALAIRAAPQTTIALF